MSEKNIVKNASQGYGYTYASLADIVNQGFKLPKMKTITEGEREFVCWYDPEIKEWIRGAEIVLPDAKGMNKAQVYGAALTYARRYTAQLALSLACGDDKQIEDIKQDGEKKKTPITKEQKQFILDNQALLIEELKKRNIANAKALDKLSLEEANDIIKVVAHD